MKEFQWLLDNDLQNFNTAQKQWVCNLVEFIINNEELSIFNYIDVGANHGHLIDAVISTVKNIPYSVVGFEPHPTLSNALQHKYSNNHCVKILPYGASDCRSVDTIFNFSNSSPGLSYILASPVPEQIATISDWQSTKIQTVLLDEYYSSNPSFIKIDAEGHDFLVLKGSKKLMLEHRPIILFEFSGSVNVEKLGYSRLDWYNYFCSVGYTLFSAIGGYPMQHIAKNFNRHMPQFRDLLAVPKEKIRFFQSNSK